MAHLLQKHYGSFRHELTIKDLMRYAAIAVVALLGIAGLLQSIAGSANSSISNETSSYADSVYGK